MTSTHKGATYPGVRGRGESRNGALRFAFAALLISFFSLTLVGCSGGGGGGSASTNNSNSSSTPPQVSSSVVQVGPDGTTMQLVVTGTGLTGNITVLINGVPATNVQ